MGTQFLMGRVGLVAGTCGSQYLSQDSENGGDLGKGVGESRTERRELREVEGTGIQFTLSVQFMTPVNGMGLPIFRV